jgi:hypothetical protein
MPGTGSLGVRFDELPHNLPTFCSTVLPGRVLKLNQELYTVVGVMPAGFVLAEKTDIFIPLLLDQSEWQQRGGHYLGGIARLKDGVTMAAALADLNGIADRAKKEHPESNTGWPRSSIRFNILSLATSRICCGCSRRRWAWSY